MIGVLVSGEGTNLQALLDAELPVVAVASNVEGARALVATRRRVLEHDGQRLMLLRAPFLLAYVSDVAFGLQELGDALLELAGGKPGQLVACHRRVTNTRQQICDRIGHHEITSSTW